MLDEARASAALDHPNIGVIHEIGETPEGQPFIAMAYYEGDTLTERIRRERLPVAEAARLIAMCTDRWLVTTWRWVACSTTMYRFPIPVTHVVT